MPLTCPAPLALHSARLRSARLGSARLGSAQPAPPPPRSASLRPAPSLPSWAPSLPSRAHVIVTPRHGVIVELRDRRGGVRPVRPRSRRRRRRQLVVGLLVLLVLRQLALEVVDRALVDGVRGLTRCRPARRSPARGDLRIGRKSTRRDSRPKRTLWPTASSVRHSGQGGDRLNCPFFNVTSFRNLSTRSYLFVPCPLKPLHSGKTLK